MILRKNTGSWIIYTSLLAALLLMAIPLPYWINDWCPVWIVMVLIYWCIALPGRVGVGSGWFLGLLFDVQQGALLGQNALGFALVAYFAVRIYKRFRVFPLVQQSYCVGLMILFYLFVISCIRGMVGIAYYTWSYWMSAITSMILWPWLFVILRNIRRRYSIT